MQAANASGGNVQGFADDGRDPSSAPVLSAYAKIAPLNWTVFVEQPRAEALAPLVASIARSAVILVVALALAATVGVVAARRMVAPIDELRRGAQRFGAGDLSHRIDVASGDELQELAALFNAMGAQLRETYADLERRVAERMRIAVWDTGCGIPDDRRKDVFHEFVQLGGAGHRRADGLGKGRGLGRAIVARLADLLGTRVELRSHVGRGSMFAFELPLGVGSEVRAQGAAAPLRVASLRGTFALVIDDDEAARAGMCGLLESWSCLTIAAADGNEAIAQLSAHDRPPELILCDYRLATAENGLDVIARIRAAVGNSVPAIVITADTSNAALSAAQAVGAPLLHKPVSAVKLRALLARLLPATGGGERATA